MKPPSDIGLKEVLVSDYAGAAKRSGLPVDMGDIERQVLSDLDMVEQYNAEQALKPAHVPVKKERDIRTDELEAELADKNMRAYVRDIPDDEEGDPILDAAPKSERMIRAFGRVKQFMRPRGDVGAVARRGGALRDCVVECTDPELSLEFLELWTWYGPLRRMPSKKNTFFYLNEYDAAAKFIRGLEDICDRSTGKFGPWWVK